MRTYTNTWQGMGYIEWDGRLHAGLWGWSLFTTASTRFSGVGVSFLRNAPSGWHWMGLTECEMYGLEPVRDRYQLHAGSTWELWIGLAFVSVTFAVRKDRVHQAERVPSYPRPVRVADD